MGGFCSDECIPLSGQRPFTISSRKITYTDFFSSLPLEPPLFLHPLPQPLDRWRNFHIVPNGSKYSQVMFTLMDGAQTLSRFCLFAVLYFIVFVIIIIIVVVVVVFLDFSYLFVSVCIFVVVKI